MKIGVNDPRLSTFHNADFSQVRVHDNAQAQADAAHLGAKAFTTVEVTVRS